MLTFSIGWGVFSVCVLFLYFNSNLANLSGICRFDCHFKRGVDYCFVRLRNSAQQTGYEPSNRLEIPFRDGYFDLIFLSAVLKHIRYEDRPKLFAEFRRVARYLYVVEKYSDIKRTETQQGFTFYYSDFRAKLGEVYTELSFSRVGDDFLALYELSD